MAVIYQSVKTVEKNLVFATSSFNDAKLKLNEGKNYRASRRFRRTINQTKTCRPHPEEKELLEKVNRMLFDAYCGRAKARDSITVLGYKVIRDYSRAIRLFCGFKEGSAHENALKNSIGETLYNDIVHSIEVLEIFENAHAAKLIKSAKRAMESEGATPENILLLAKLHYFRGSNHLYGYKNGKSAKKDLEIAKGLVENRKEERGISDFYKKIETNLSAAEFYAARGFSLKKLRESEKPQRASLYL